MNKKETTRRAAGKGKNIVIYAISAMLVTLYVVVLWWGMHPNVGIEYRMYYITHELSDWPGYGNLSYDLGTVEYCTELKDRNGVEVTYNVCQRKGQGWEEDQYDGSLNSGDTAYIYYLPTTTKENATYQITVTSFEGTQPVDVYVNDTLIGQFDQSGTYQFPISQVNQNEQLTIKFETQQSVFCLWSTQID